MGDYDFELTRKTIKNVNLRLSKDGNIKVSAPKRVPLSYIRSFVTQHEEWIAQRQREISKQQANIEAVSQPLNSGSKIYLWGDQLTLELRNSSRVHIVQQDQTLIVYCPLNTTTDEHMRKYLIEWYRVLIKREVPALLDKWSAVTGIPAKHWGVKKMKTKWGSCNIQAARIWLNLDLIHYPKACLEYVIVHELTHLHERYHNKRFYALQDKFMPEWRTYEAQLNNFKI